MAEQAFNITAEDLQNANRVYEQETIKVLTNNELFKAGIYCILAVSEKYERQQKVYKELLENRLDTPDAILANKGPVKQITSSTRWPRQRRDRIAAYSAWWPAADIGERIIQDANSGRHKELELTVEFGDTAPGIGEKSACFIMNKAGFENVAPLDIHLLRAMKELGFEIEIPDYETKSGPKKKEYYSLLDKFQTIAGRMNIKPVILQYAIWSRYSTWKNIHDNYRNV